MSRMSELAAELPPEDGNAELHFDLVAALTRVAAGTSTDDDARLLCYACNVDVEEIGLSPVRVRLDVLPLL
jgi:hypothetical protein